MNNMKFAQRDFSAILKLGIQLISNSDNPQNAAAAHKLIYGLARFVTEDRIQSVQTMANLIDFETAAVIVANFDEEEFDWAKDLLYEVATTDVELNDAQRAIFDNLVDLYWQNQPADDDGRYDFEV